MQEEPAAEAEADDPGEAVEAAGDVREVMPLHLRVQPECDRWRLDHFLKHRIHRLSRTKIRDVIATQVRLPDARRARPATPVRSGEVIRIDRPAPREPEVPRHFTVVTEDPSFIVIEKPAGLPIHTTAKFWKNTLTALLSEIYPGQGLQVCHRLDRETSGLLLIARGAETSARLKQAFAKRKVDKTYLALVHGVPPGSGTMDRPMKLLDSPTRLMMGVAADGLPAVTRYEVLRAYERHALLACHPETGRQHQIRVHLAAAGHPIVGDKLYGAGEQMFMDYCDGGLTPALLEAFDGLPRHALHAHRLVFPHPVTGAAVEVASPWPADLAAYAAALEQG